MFHEKAHLRRRDHIWKPLGFLLLTVYWFNPLLWVAYILLCKDIELACDEKVIRELGAEIKKDEANKSDNVIITDSGTDYEGVSWIIDSVNKELHAFLSWTNDTDKDIFFGDTFSVYKVSDAEGTVDLLPCKMKEGVGFNAIAYLVKSSDTYQSSYRLRDYYDITSTGKQRLTVAFTVSGDRKTYTAWADFIIGGDVVTIEHQYRASSWIYDCGYGITDLEKEQFRISEDMVLMHNDFLTPNWYDIGRLTEFQLTEDNFDKLAISPIWKDGYSAAKNQQTRSGYLWMYYPPIFCRNCMWAIG